MSLHKILKTTVVLAGLTIAVLIGACARSPEAEAREAEAREAPGTEASPEPVTAPTEGEVSYEPAYPEDVSTEALTEEDLAQQETGYSHGEGSDHDHADGTGDEHDH